MFRKSLKFFLFLTCFVLPVRASGQQLPFSLPVPTPGVASYDSEIPTHMEVIGHEIGQHHTRPDQIVTYFETLAEVSDRVRLGWHGMTYEGRPLVHAIVSSRSNLANLDAIRAANTRLSDEASDVTDAELTGMPAIVYMGYSVHGNEASGSEAGMLLLYYLAAGNGRGIDELLESTVIILDPSLNPDGRDRFADWVNRNRGRVATTDRADREHNEPWPGGRTNHYLFDLNRDWLPAQHPESQGRLELFHSWRPQILTDYHEMGGNATYFFQPGIPSRANPNTPQRTFDITGEIAAYHAQYLDEMGSLYYSEESFDDFYYGKGSTYPDVNGAIGILFEQASSRALKTETSDGELGYPFTVRNHFTASLSTLRAATEMRGRLLRHQRDFYRDSPEVARSLPMSGYVFGSGEYRTRTQALVEMLLRHRIQVHRLAQPFGEFQPGDAYVIPMNQPQVRLVKTMMERVTEFTDSLFYDVSAWTMPLAFGVPDAPINGSLNSYLGGRVESAVFDGGDMIGGTSNVAYAFEWGRYYSARALWRLQGAGVAARLMTSPFSGFVEGQRRDFDRGTIVIPVVSRDGAGPDPEALRGLLETIASEDHIEFFALDGGSTPTGVDLGSGSASVLRQPSVAVLSGRGTSGYRVGEAWHLLNERMGIPVSLLDVSRFGSADLSRYTTILMTGFSSGLSESDVEKLKTWVRRGGVLIATGSSVSWAIRQELVDAETKEVPSVGDGETPYADRSALTGAQFLGGTIFKTTLDTTHPLAYGHPAQVSVFKTNRTILIPSEDAGENVSRFPQQALESGYVSPPVYELFEGGASIIGARSGGGRVVLFTEDPNFRAFWYGTNGLLLNAVFFGSAF